MDRKKELKEQYQMMKPHMGLFVIKSKFENKCYIEGTQNIKGAINGTVFKLNFGNHPNKELQRAWTERGENSFTIEILEKLEYDEDETKTDYSEELEILELEWKDNLRKEGMDFYRK
mgnify:CR=1 FL=1